MRALAPREVLEVWEAGIGRSSVWRTLSWLDSATSDADWNELADLSIGELDRRLLELRALTLGPKLEVVAHCASCAEAVQLTLETDQLIVPVAEREHDTLSLDGLELRFRLPTGGDLLAMEVYGSSEEARRALVERCVASAWRGKSEITAGDLTEDEMVSLAKALADADPQAEIVFDLECPACGESWYELFDVSSFFWGELCVQADRLLRQVHVLAGAYGWCEAEVLALSPRRRQAYLEMVAG